MRVLYLNYEWDLEASSGAATHMLQQAAGLERLGHRVEIVHRHRKPLGHPTAAATSRARHLWLWEAANYWRSIGGINEEAVILRRERPDVVFVLHALRFSSLIAARRLGVPVVVNVNASVPFEIRRYHPEVHLLPVVSESIERRILLAADRVFVVSNVLRDYLAARGIDPALIDAIPNGADTAVFHPGAADPALREQFRGRILIGFAGSFAPFHGLSFLEHAVARVAAMSPEAHFIFAGGGPGAEALRERCLALGCGQRVTFLGSLPHEKMPGVVAAMDVLVAPYPAVDCFYFSPVKLFEYMACGRAVVAARLGQIAEVVEHEANGLLYNAASAQDFVDKIVALVRDPGKRSLLGAQARRTIERQYTWDHHARSLARVLESAIEAKSAACHPERNEGSALQSTADSSLRSE